MRVLGYPLTYPTRCFIAGGCGAAVYAHTQGYGDFVLFDDLGWPWEIHSCYLNLRDPGQFETKPPAPDAYTNQEWAQEQAKQSQAYKDAARAASLDRSRRPIQNIVKVSPESVPAPIQVYGYVQDIIEKQAAKTLRNSGGLGQQLVLKGLGTRQTQLTIIDRDFKSYTGFADVQQIVLGRGSTLVAIARRTRIVGLGDVFLFDAIDVLPMRPEGEIRAR